MLFTNEIPHLKVYSMRTYLPVDKKRPTMNSLVFMLTNAQQDYKSIINNPKVYHNNKFFLYYADFFYKYKIHTKQVREMLKKERLGWYDQVENSIKTMNTINLMDQSKNRNIYVDLFHHNELFFNNTMTLNYQKKIEQYIKFIKEIIEDEKYTKYPIRTMVIDVDNWFTNIKKQMSSKISFDNPVFIMFYAMYKYPETFKTLGDIDIIITSNEKMIRVNPRLTDKDSFKIFKRELMKINQNIVLSENEEEVEQEMLKTEVISNVVKTVGSAFNIIADDEKSQKALEEKISKKVEEIIEAENKDIKNKKDIENINDSVINNEEIAKEIYKLNQTSKVGKSNSSSKRDEELRKKQFELKLDNMTIDEIRNINSSQIKMEVNDVTNSIKTTNKNMQKIKYPNFEAAYNENLYKKDLTNVILSLNDKSIPVYVRDIKVQDNSDELNYKETYIVDLEDENRVRHKLKIDMPKFIDDRFLYLNGNTKMIVKQEFMKPVVKTGPDEVQICTNYNKIFIRRYGQKASPKIEKFKKYLAENKNSAINVKYGSNFATNTKYKSLIEYDELSKDFSEINIKVKNKNIILLFNQDDISKIITENSIKSIDTSMVVGFRIIDKKYIPIYASYDSQLIEDKDIVDFIVSEISDIDPNINDVMKSLSAGKKFVYSRATIMKKQVPLILLLAYTEGLTTVLRKAGIKTHFSDTRPKIDERTEGVVRFSDGYLIYDKYPYENSLLMNAFEDIPTKNFEYNEFDDKVTYLAIFDEMFNSTIIANAFDNFYEFLIDPITLEVLDDMNYPKSFVDLILYANKLLADNSSIKENNMNIYRIRSNELINAYLYKGISTAYARYRLTSNNNNPVKISLPQDYVIKKLLMSQNLEDYSTLNPIVELEKHRAVTPKGHVGLNVDEAYTQDKRSYDDTMLGVLAMSTSPDALCGVTRQLTMEPNIVNPRGYIDIKSDNVKELNDINLFSPAELLSPLGASRDKLLLSHYIEIYS